MSTPVKAIEPLTQRIQQLERLLEVSRSLSAMLDLDPLLQSIVDVAAELTYSEEASILMYNERVNRLEFAAAPWFKRDVMQTIPVPLEGSIAGEAFMSCEPVMVRKAQDDPRLYRQVDESADYETRCLLAVPLQYQGISTGVLTAVNKKGDLTYNDEDILILETLASQAAIAIQNAKLLRNTQAAYDEVARLDQMKSDFIAITSHELRTPLGLILGHATFLLETVPEEMHNQMEVIARNANKLKEIIESLGEVNVVDSGAADVDHAAVNVHLLINDIVTNYKEEAKNKEVALNVDLPRRRLRVEGDTEKISIAVNNLVKNAITFTDEGGEVKVAAEELPGFVKIMVADTGVGIPQKDMPRVFERFYQVESHMTRKHGGMGIGLAVAKMMVEMHSGRITVQSKEGEGSTFSILLPTTLSQMNAAQRVFLTN
ncbi:MAG: GAF domain-containing sensor histidine kinase [Chloroflexi bacterium]|nr:GAF domain-containing sensor histidine kinase [Chloroflexota bacterium]